MMKGVYTYLTALLMGCLFLPPGEAYGQQPLKPVQVDATNVPGGKVVLVPRSQLRASPGTKTLRLPHTLRAALDAKTFTPPATWDWSTKDGKRLDLPMMGNDRYGDCYPVTTVKLAMMWMWQNTGQQMPVDTTAVVNWYLQVAGGDNGTTDEMIFPEFRKGVVPPSRPHKALDILIVPASDKTALRLANYAFGSTMFTFTVYQNFMNVAPGTVMKGNSGRQVGGHAIPFSGLGDKGWAGETWGFKSPFWATDEWIAGVDPEFVAVFSLDWFNAKGYAPNGLHFTVLAPMWNSMGGNVSLVSPFPPPTPDPPPPPPIGDTEAPVAVRVDYMIAALRQQGYTVTKGGSTADVAVDKAVADLKAFKARFEADSDAARAGTKALDIGALLKIIQAIIEALQGGKP